MEIVLACGCFDLLHYGHLRHLKHAKSLGDKLIVCLTTAKYVNKGKGRPVFTDEQRREMLLELRCVDQVIVNPYPDPENIIRRVMPSIYVKGSEYKGRLQEQKLVESLGGRVVFTGTPIYSSTALLNYGR